MTQFLKKLKDWLAKLAFWRKAAAVADAQSEAESTPADTTDEAAPGADQTAAMPGWRERLKGLFAFRRKKADTSESTEAAAPEADAKADADQQAQPPSSDETEIPAPKPSLAARLKRIFRFRRKPVEADTDADDKTQVIEQASAASDATAAEGEADAPPPSRIKRIVARLRSKWVWIPALGLALIAIASWIVVIMMHAASEKTRLQTELAAAKKMLEQKPVAAAAPVAPPPAAAPAKPEPKIDPAFNIVGYVPAAQSEDASGINAADCVITDKNSVAENLKHCITSFNQAVASTPNKSKKP